MSWKQSYFLPELSIDQIKLGRLVTNPWVPYDAYHDPPNFSQPSQVHNVTHYSSTLYYNNEDQGRIYLKLSTLFRINRDSRKNVLFKIEAESTTSQTLSDFSAAFRAMWGGSALESDKEKSAVATKQWIQNRLQDGQEVYLIVGLKTVTNARVTIHDVKGSEVLVGGSAPISELVPPPFPKNTIMDLMITMGVGRASGSGESYEVRGTYVIAVQYCKLKVMKWWKGKNGDVKLSSEDIVWEWLIGDRARLQGHSRGAIDQDQLMMTVSLGPVVDAQQLVDSDEEIELEQEDPIESFSFDDVELVY